MSNFDTRFVKFLTILLILVLMSGLGGCSDSVQWNQTSSDSLTDTSSIIGGQAVAADSELAGKVILLALGVNKKRTRFGFILSQKAVCTAVAISSRVLLTAAHCVANYKPEAVYAVLNANNASNNIVNLDKWIAVEKIKLHKNFFAQRNNIQNDLALLRLSGDIAPQSLSKLIDPAILPKTSSFEVLIAGYGDRTIEKPSTERTLNQVNKLLEIFHSTDLVFEIDQNDQRGVCFGDSGGPVFVVDSETKIPFLLGVTSYVSNENSPQKNTSPCLGKAYYTNVLVYNDWIQKSLIELIELK